jgi:hypothetical protein
MQLSGAPAKLVEAFAAGGVFNVIPVPSQIPVTPGAASWTTGFPPLTMVPPTAGGIGPSGLDFNGIFNAISALSIWFNTGAGFPYDPTFAATVGGYPKGARVLAATGVGYWLSTVDNNLTDPDTGGAGWTLQGVVASSSVFANAPQTFAVGNPKVLFNTIEFDEGLWNPANQAFIAPFVGKYRVSGAVLVNQSPGQELATQIFHNGVLAKQCFQAPQVSTGNLSMPFDAIIQCAVADTMAIQMTIPTFAVVGGIEGNNQQFVFAQCQYLGT